MFSDTTHYGYQRVRCRFGYSLMRLEPINFFWQYDDLNKKHKGNSINIYGNQKQTWLGIISVIKSRQYLERRYASYLPHVMCNT